MKTREGTVVDADDIVDEMESISAKHTLELGKVKDFTDDELKQLYTTIGLGALKFFLLRVDPKKKDGVQPGRINRFSWFHRTIYSVYICPDKIHTKKRKAVFRQQG